MMPGWWIARGYRGMWGSSREEMDAQVDVGSGIGIGNSIEKPFKYETWCAVFVI